MRTPTNRASRHLAIKRQIGGGTYDESVLAEIVEALLRDPPWALGDPVLRLGQGEYARNFYAHDLLPPSSPSSPKDGGGVSSETKP